MEFEIGIFSFIRINFISTIYFRKHAYKLYIWNQYFNVPNWYLYVLQNCFVDQDFKESILWLKKRNVYSQFANPSSKYEGPSCVNEIYSIFYSFSSLNHSLAKWWHHHMTSNMTSCKTSVSDLSKCFCRMLICIPTMQSTLDLRA